MCRRNVAAVLMFLSLPYSLFFILPGDSRGGLYLKTHLIFLLELLACTYGAGAQAEVHHNVQPDGLFRLNLPLL